MISSYTSLYLSIQFYLINYLTTLHMQPTILSYLFTYLLIYLFTIVIYLFIYVLTCVIIYQLV